MPELVNGWRACELRAEACNRRFEDMEKFFKVLIESAKDAVTTAKDEMDRRLGTAKDEMDLRLAGMNDFREQLENQTQEFVNQDIYDREHRFLAQQINELREWKSLSMGAKMTTDELKFSSSAKIGMVVGFAVLLVSALSGVVQLLHMLK